VPQATLKLTAGQTQSVCRSTLPDHWQSGLALVAASKKEVVDVSCFRSCVEACCLHRGKLFRGLIAQAAVRTLLRASNKF
jgi:hypothetical protein